MSVPTSQHPVRSWLAVIAIFGLSGLVAQSIVFFLWPAPWPTHLLALLAYWLG